METNTVNRSRMKLVLIALIFFVPLVAATLVYYHRSDLPLKTNSHGQLIKPPVESRWLLKAATLPKKWHIVYYPDNCCDKLCKNVVDHLGQVYKALGKEKPRVDVVVLVDSKQCDIKTNPALHVFVMTEKDIVRVRQAFLKRDMTVPSLFIMDPLGNMMMYYPQHQPYRMVYKDMKKLLRISQIG